MDITNTHSAPLYLPNGQVLQPRASLSLEAEAWSEMEGHAVVKAWVAEKKLSKGAAPKEAEPDEKPVALDSMTDDELRIFLKDGGVNADGRWGRDKLMAEAKKLQPKA